MELSSLTWRCCPFRELNLVELHDILRVRLQVFVIEQRCLYLDVDGVDEACWHLAARAPGGREPVAYARLVAPGLKYAEPSIGRVITTAAARGTGLGRVLVARAVAEVGRLWPGQGIRISAQAHLERFYAEVGFVAQGMPYDEDGIPHVEMLRPAATSPT